METIDKYNHEASFSRSFGNGWKVFGDQFLVLFLVTIILFVIDAPTHMTKMFNFHFDPSHSFSDFGSEHLHWFVGWWAALGAFVILIGLIALAYSFLLVPVFDYGSSMIFVQAARKKRPDFSTLISGFQNNYFHIILANLLTTALVLIGFFAIIVPGIIIACRLAFVSYLVMDKKLDPIAAVEESWRMTRHHGWTIFFMAIVSFFIVLLGILLCFVGIFPAIVWIRGSFACLYEAVSEERNQNNHPSQPEVQTTV
jgi:uncharacterized membrane protein